MRRAVFRARHVMAVAWVLSMLAVRAGTAHAEDERRLCARAASRAELLHRLPANLLLAMAEVESGRWPWAVRARGIAYMAPSGRAAAALVRSLQRRGVRDVIVGCLQVNLRYHGQAFIDIEEAVEPSANAAYAGRLIESLHGTGSWWEAVALYQGGAPSARRAYVAKVAAALRRAAEAAAPPASPLAARLVDSVFDRPPEGVVDLGAFPDLPFTAAQAPAAPAARPPTLYGAGRITARRGGRLPLA